MKHLSILLACCLFLVNCSSDNDTSTDDDTTPVEVVTPTVTSISTEAAKIGDIITINGHDFNTDDTYTVSFNGALGIINEITATTIKVEIPQDATSGDIVFTHNGTSTVIGNITIPVNRLYAYKYFGGPSGNSSDQKQIVEIDIANGAANVVVPLDFNSTYLGNLIFDSSNNTIIGLYDVNDNSISQSLAVINLDTKTSQLVNLNNVSENSRYSSLVLGADNKLYGYKYFGYASGNTTDKKQIVEIEKTNGTAKLVTNLDLSSTYLANLMYVSDTNSIIGLYDVDDNSVSQSLVSINLADGATNLTDLNNVSENSRYNGLIMGQDNKLYGYKYFGYASGNTTDKKQIVEIDKTNGNSKLLTTLDIPSTYIENMFYNNYNNTILGIYDINDNSVTQSLFTYNLTDNTYKLTELNNVSENSRYGGLLTNQ